MEEEEPSKLNTNTLIRTVPLTRGQGPGLARVGKQAQDFPPPLLIMSLGKDWKDPMVITSVSLPQLRQGQLTGRDELRGTTHGPASAV